MAARNTTSENRPAILGGVPTRPEGPPDWPIFDSAVQEAIRRMAADGSWGKYHGPHHEKLATALSAYHGCEHTILCASGTAAVELALRGLNVGPGDEVVLAAYDFKGNFQDVLVVGATPVLVDSHPGNWNLDPDRLEAGVGPKTKAIIATHLHGGVVPMSQVMDVAGRHGVPVIEDACQMPGADIEGRKAGTWGDVGIHSFGGSKLLTAGRGGALITNDAQIVQRARLYSQRGNEAYPLSEMQAAVLLPQLQQLDQRNAHRQLNVARLSLLLSARPGLEPLRNEGVTATPGYYKLGLKYDAGEFDGLSRDDFTTAMRAEGIAIDSGFRALHKIHSRRRFRAAGELTAADMIDERVLTLHHPVLLGDERDIDQIAAAVDKVRRHATMISKNQSG